MTAYLTDLERALAGPRTVLPEDSMRFLAWAWRHRAALGLQEAAEVWPLPAVWRVYHNHRVFARGKRAGHSPLDLSTGGTSPELAVDFWIDLAERACVEVSGRHRAAYPCSHLGGTRPVPGQMRLSLLEGDRANPQQSWESFAL